jgi:predicted PurR-regulated permease PerM
MISRVKTIIDGIKLVVQQYITGIIIVIFILSILNSILLLIIGVDHAIFFGVFAAMLNVVPFIGPIFGSILPIIYSLLTMDSLIYPLMILLGFYIIQLFESNLFTPVIVGSKVSMNALLTLLLLFIGAQIWGLVGMILFIPMGAILKVVFDEIDSLKPYGFLLGRVPQELQKSKGPLARRISEIGKQEQES